MLNIAVMLRIAFKAFLSCFWWVGEVKSRFYDRGRAGRYPPPGVISLYHIRADITIAPT